MIRTTARPMRIGAATIGIAGALALAGCANATTSGAGTAGSGSTDESASDPSSSGSSNASYKDGTYTAEGAYRTPESSETISVTLTLKDDVVTAVSVDGKPSRAETQQYQSQFIGGISAAVVGKDIDTLSVSRVAGSSLTSQGFNQALDEIKSEASA